MNMAIFAGNIGFKISCQLHSRVFSIPRTIWKCHIVCLKIRDFSSYDNVRYIHNSSSKSKNLENFSSASHHDASVPRSLNGRRDVHGSVANSEISRDPKEIRNNFMFDDSEEGCDQMEEVGEAVEELTINQIGDTCEQDSIQIEKFTNDAEESAIKLLASRALTAVELRKKLLGKRFSPNAVETVVNKFQSRGLINDRLYAESFSQSRWSSSSWGPRRIKQALFKKGISQADAEKAVEVVFKGNGCDEDQKSVIGLSKQSIDHLYAQAAKQWSRGQNVPTETRKSRIVRWLQYRGFDWNVINFILKKLERQEEQYPP